MQALAGSLEYNICVLNLSERGLTDDKLNHLLANAPDRAFILLEDIDAAFSGRAQSSDQGYVLIHLLFSRIEADDRKHSYSSHVTFSGLLNALDGVASSTSQRLLFMTTNHVSRLDPALIRPGRVDLRLEIGDATPLQALALFTRFYPDADPSLRNRFQSLVSNCGRVSMAALQGHFIRHDEPKDALEDYEDMVRSMPPTTSEVEKSVTPSMPN